MRSHGRRTMFASFQATSTGLTRITQRPRLTRSDSGCLPCTRSSRPSSKRGARLTEYKGRRKRKKCDNRKPRCGRCCNSHKQDVCLWPSTRRTRSTSCEERQSPNDSEAIDSLSSTSQSPRAEIVATSLTPSLSDLRLPDLPPASLPDTVTTLSPYVRPASHLFWHMR